MFETLLRHAKMALANGTLPPETQYRWFFNEDEGVPYAHRLLQAASPDNIQWMLCFIAGFSEGQIFSFLMLRDSALNTIGHVVCSQAFSERIAVVDSGVLAAFFRCLEKLSLACRQELALACNQSEYRIDDLMTQMRFDVVKQTYFRLFREMSEKRLKKTEHSAFEAVPAEIFIPTALPERKLQRNHFFTEEQNAETSSAKLMPEKRLFHRKSLLPPIERAPKETSEGKTFHL